MMPSALTGRPRLVAVPTPADGVRRAWEVSLIANGAEPRAVATLVDAETGAVLIRENLVDHLPPTTRRGRSSRARRHSTTASTDTRRALVLDRHDRLRARGRQHGVAGAVGRRRAHQRARRSRPRATTRSPSTTGSATIRSRVGTERATSRPDREYTYTWTNQWHEQRCNPAVFDVAAAQRHRRGAGEPVRDAQPDARLGVPPRLHRGRLEPAVVQLRPRRRGERSASAATPRPAASAAARRLRRARQREPDHAAGRHGADHQHVPVAADRGRVLRAVRGRRLRHVGDRARVHPRDLQPHGRRPERQPVRQPGRARWARAGRTSTRSST